MRARYQSAGQVEVDRQQAHHGHHQPDLQDARPHARVDHPFGPLARWSGHHVAGDRIRAHRQRRSGIGDEVDPQDLRGQQRQHDAARRTGEPEHTGADHAQEDRQHLAQVR